MNEMTRRDTLRLGLTTAAGLALVPEWALPVLAQGDGSSDVVDAD